MLVKGKELTTGVGCLEGSQEPAQLGAGPPRHGHRVVQPLKKRDSITINEHDSHTRAHILGLNEATTVAVFRNLTRKKKIRGLKLLNFSLKKRENEP
jgi:hypothetical protein